MGLDQYLKKMPRYKGATANDVSMVESYLDWIEAKNKGSEHANCTFKQWCGRDVDFNNNKVNDLIDFYSQFYEKKYSDWDIEKKYGYARIMDQVGYWRKANQIHNWFVENVQDGEDDCRYHREVTKEDLEELLDICETIKRIAIMESAPVENGYVYENGKQTPIYEDGALIVNAAEIENLLPTQSGFFFGGTGYDSYYMNDIEHTIDVITKVIETTDFDREMLYYISSW